MEGFVTAVRGVPQLYEQLHELCTQSLSIKSGRPLAAHNPAQGNLALGGRVGV